MAVYKFTEIDNTKASTLRNDATNNVLIPINSTWGPDDKPVLIQSTAELKATFGDDAESTTGRTTITSYQYATDILKSGFSLLAKRIGKKDFENAETVGLTKANSGESVKTYEIKTKLDSDSKFYVTIGEDNPTKADITAENGTLKLKKFTCKAEGLDEAYIITQVGYMIGNDETEKTTTAVVRVGDLFTATLGTSEDITSTSPLNNLKVYYKKPEEATEYQEQAELEYYDMTENEYVVEVDKEIKENDIYKVTYTDSGEREATSFTSEIIGEETKKTKVSIPLIRNTSRFPVKSTIYYYSAHSYTPGIEAMYDGSTGNSISVSFDTEYYDGKQITLTSTNGSYYRRILYAKVIKSDDILEKTPIGICTKYIDDQGRVNYEFTPSNSIVSEYVNFTSVEVNTSGTATASDTSIKLSNGSDLQDRATALQAVSIIFDDKDGRYCFNDKWLYDIKFICNGGLVEESNAQAVAQSMITLADNRADCVAFIDSYKIKGMSGNDGKTLTQSFFDTISNSSYASAYAPWCSGTVMGSSTVVDIPATYYAITSLAKSYSNGNNICFAPAGVTRGLISIKEPGFIIGTSTMEEWQKGESSEMSYCINPIMNIRKYGYCIFGQRDFMQLAYGMNSAVQELGVRLTINEIKKWVRDVAVSLTFESNTNRTWNEFVSKTQQCLDKLVSDGLLTAYEISRNEDVSDQINTNTLGAVISVYVTRALENFDITVEVNSGEVTFEESNG